MAERAKSHVRQKAKNKQFHRTVQDLIDKDEEPPLPLSVIPNYMGINLCSVDSVSWEEQPDGQLVQLTIHFTPARPTDPHAFIRKCSSDG